MRYGGAREGDGGRPEVLLVEEHPDHAVVLCDLLAELGFRVRVVGARDALGVTVAGPVLLSTATEPEAAARLLAALGSRRAPVPLFILDGPGRRWEPSAAAGGAVAGVIAKETDTAFLDRLGDLLRAWEEAGSPTATGSRTGGGGRAPVFPGSCTATLVRIRLARLARLLARLAPLAGLGGPAAAPLAEVLAEADRLAHRLAGTAGKPPPRVAVPFRPVDLVRVRRAAWEIVGGFAVRVVPGSVAAETGGEIFPFARLLDGLVLGAAAPAGRQEEVRVSVRHTETTGKHGTIAVTVAPAGPGEAGEACRELADELGLHLAAGDGERVLSLPRAAGRAATDPAGPPTVLVVAPPGTPGDDLAAFGRERRARVTRAGSAEELRELLTAGCRYDLVFLALPGEGLAGGIREALPRAALVGLGEAAPGDVAALLEADGLGWLEVPLHPEDLAATWRLAAVLA